MNNPAQALLLLFVCLLMLPAYGGEPSRPNIVVLFADDLGYGDLGSYGHPYIRTPNLDQLASEGQRWTDFYVAAPVCSPSRGALLTGRLPVRTGLYGERIRVYFPDDPYGIPADEVTLAELLQSAGYRTGIFGKWHLGDAKHAWPTRHGFDEWLGLPYSNDMDWVGEPTIDEMLTLRAQGRMDEVNASLARRPAGYASPREEMWNVPLMHSRSNVNGFEDRVVQRPAPQAELTRRYTEAAVEFMREAGDQPFFVYLPYAMPHTPLFRSKPFEGRSLGGRYGDVVEELDWSAGRVRQALEELGIAENTLLVFTSDNGPWLSMRTEGGGSGLLRDGKGTTFEGGMRVPAVFWWPGQIAPGVISELGSAMDIFNTVAHLAGLDATSATDGVDLSGVLLKQESSPRNELAYYRSGALYAYRIGPWKAHFITEGAYGLGPPRTEHDTPELYHLLNDPSERFDVAAEHPEVIARILDAVEKHKANLTRKPPEFDRRLARVSGQSEP